MIVSVCVSLSVTKCNNNPLHPQRIGRRDQNEKDNLNCVFKYHKYIFMFCLLEAYRQTDMHVFENIWNEVMNMFCTVLYLLGNLRPAGPLTKSSRSNFM